MLRVIGLDHIVLVTPDVERSLTFYRDELDLVAERVDEWRDGRAPFPSVRLDETTIIDILQGDRSGTNLDHLCLVVDPVDLEAVKASGRFTVVDGPAPRLGAQGTGTSLYVLDPDGNVVELRHYGGG